LERKIDVILHKLDRLLTFAEREKMTLDELQLQVTQNTTVEASAITLIQGLAAQLAAAAQDPVKVQALADELNASATALAAAVTANTPAVPQTAAARTGKASA
jgi:hypothetical protein